MIRAIIFDMDGVVVDSEPLYQQAEERLFAEYGVAVPPEDWKIFRGCTEERFYALARKMYGIEEPAESLRLRGRKYVLEAFEAGLDFNTGFRELHRRLVGKYHLGLVTSTPEEIFNWMDSRLKLRQYFDEVIYAGMTANSKPHPEPYLEMMHKLEVSGLETVIIEDSISGLTSALAAGALTIALTGSAPVAELPPAHAIVDSLHEITANLLGRFEQVPDSSVQELA